MENILKEFFNYCSTKFLLNLNDKILIDNDCHGNPFLRVQQRYRSITFPSTENSIERRELFATRAKIVENRGGYFPRYNWFDTIGAIFKRPLTNGTSQWSGLLTRALNGFNIPTSKEELSAIYQYLSNSTAIAAPGVLCKYDKVSDIFFFLFMPVICTIGWSMSIYNLK